MHRMISSGVLLLLLFWLAIAGCQGVVQESLPSPQDVDAVYEPLTSPNRNLLDEMDFTIADHGRFMENQLLLIGLRQDVETVARELGINVETVPTVSFGFLEGTNLTFQTPFDSDIENLVIQLVTEQRDVYEWMEEVLTLSQVMSDNQEISAPVFAEPNYVTGRPPTLVGGYPHSVGAHPFGDAGVPQDGDSFLAQWAFSGTHGIGLYHSGTQTRVITATGSGTYIHLFDTSPFEDPGAKSITVAAGHGSTTKGFGVSHMATGIYHNLPGDATEMADHGLFALGLAYWTAPDVDVELIQVLNENGLGDLFRLTDALVLTTAKHRDPTTGLANHIYNLSLGIYPASFPASGGMPLSLLDLLTGYIGKLGYAKLSPGLLAPVMSFETTLRVVDTLSAVVVAAAGNSSGEIDIIVSPPSVMEPPAAYTNVIGVAGSTSTGLRSCFSNIGDVAAPAGDGAELTCDPAVISDTTQCDGPECPYGMISLVLTSTAPEEYGFAYWLGTSFAAPLVSGAAALGLSDGMAPEEIKERIRTKACPSTIPAGQLDADSLGSGIVNTFATLLDDPDACGVNR